jgi:hypothetical protein
MGKGNCSVQSLSTYIAKRSLWSHLTALVLIYPNTFIT